MKNYFIITELGNDTCWLVKASNEKEVWQKASEVLDISDKMEISNLTIHQARQKGLYILVVPSLKWIWPLTA